MKLHNRQALVGLLAFLGYLGLNMFFPTIVYILFGVDFSTFSFTVKLTMGFIFNIITSIFLFLLFKDTLKKAWNDFKINHQSYLIKYSKIWGLALLLMIICNIILSSITGNDTSNNQEVLNSVFDISPIYIFFSAVIFAPIMEELVFRQGFRQIYRNDTVFIIVSGLAFGAMHTLSGLSSDNLEGLLYIIPYSIPGFAFAYMLVKSKNILVSILFHFIHNGLSVSLMFLALLLS